MGKEEGPEALKSGERDPQGGLWRPGPCLSTAEANGLPGIHHDRDNTCPGVMGAEQELSWALRSLSRRLGAASHGAAAAGRPGEAVLLSHVGCCMQKLYGAAAPFVVGLWSRGGSSLFPFGAALSCNVAKAEMSGGRDLLSDPRRGVQECVLLK